MYKALYVRERTLTSTKDDACQANTSVTGWFKHQINIVRCDFYDCGCLRCLGQKRQKEVKCSVKLESASRDKIENKQQMR